MATSTEFKGFPETQKNPVAEGFKWRCPVVDEACVHHTTSDEDS